MNSLFDLDNSTFNGCKITIIFDNKNNPWFCANEIGEIIGYNNSNKIVTDDVEEKYVKMFKDIDYIQKDTNQNINDSTKFISESGLYQLIFTSKLPFCKNFKKCVTSEVFPFNN